MDPDDRDRHVAEPTYHPDVSVDAELAPGFSQQVENTNNSNYLDSLDPSLLGSPDFDFSCLMDLDGAAEATQESEHLDSMMLDAPAFEAPCVMDDLNMTQILTSKVFHGSDHPGTNLYLVHEAPQHQVYVPQFQVGPDSMTSMTSENYQFSTEAPNTFENPSVESFVHSVGMTPLMPELPQLSGFRDQRFIHINEPPTQAQVPLPRPSRPIRRGRLTREQAEGQARARENGVCIRCRRNEPSMDEAFFIARLSEEWAIGALWLSSSVPDGYDFFETETDFTRTFAFQGLYNICFPDRRYQKPRTSMVRKAEAQLLRIFPAHTAGSPCLLVGNDRLKWTREIAVFCDDRCLDNPYEDDLVMNTGIGDGSSTPFGLATNISWLLSRYVELQLFRYLQNAANNPSKDSYEQRNFTYSALYLLGHSFSISSAKISGPDTSDEIFKDSVADHSDRERRVRLALWIYVSITVGQLPSEANFWKNLPNELKAFRGGLPKKFRDSFDGFNNSLHTNMKIELGFKARFLQQLHSGQQTQEPVEAFAPSSDIDHDRNLWQSILDRTYQGIPEMYHLNSGESTTFGDRVREYEQIEAERLFLPTNQEHFKRAVENTFGTILALASLPIRSQQKLLIEGWEVFRPSFLSFEIELLRFMGRLSICRFPRGKPIVCFGEYPFVLHGADDMHLARWQELENMMGEGIFLAGNTAHRCAREASHAFLDIATVTDTGTDVQFLRLKRLLQQNGSWLRQVMHSMTTKDYELFGSSCDERYEKSLGFKERHVDLRVCIAKIQDVYSS
ncbi:uncharacterized protein FPRO_11218 [Fusarium proliferatum ET1]|uniref:Uncharacterized protein n=1 Tax=Fusarium proliferatum (strain ET1) TaxID=1227346 RepID=A0A1L7VM85_FUSPR|nr:uncharacterized protein FPRO_11218 [Fusarium proliferatum ET1]CZR41629.1 uncharacterized protein FPRO_11218 [Fusarium proliferatum ET1]